MRGFVVGLVAVVALLVAVPAAQACNGVAAVCGVQAYSAPVAFQAVQTYAVAAPVVQYQVQQVQQVAVPVQSYSVGAVAVNAGYSSTAVAVRGGGNVRVRLGFRGRRDAVRAARAQVQAVNAVGGVVAAPVIVY